MHGVFQKRQQGEAFSEKILMFYFFSHCSKIELIPEFSRLTTPVDNVFFFTAGLTAPYGEFPIGIFKLPYREFPIGILVCFFQTKIPIGNSP